MRAVVRKPALIIYCFYNLFVLVFSPSILVTRSGSSLKGRPRPIMSTSPFSTAMAI